MLHNRCMGIYKFGNNTYPRRIKCRSNLGHIFREKSASYGPGNTVIGLRPIYNTGDKDLTSMLIIFKITPLHGK
jgi:hypothetical protein